MEGDNTVQVVRVTKTMKTVTGKRLPVLTVARWVVSLGLIFWIMRSANVAEVFSAIRSVDLMLLVLAYSLHIVGYYVSALRWRVLLGAQGVVASVAYLIKAYMVSAFFNNFLPSTIGGDVVRAYDSWRVGTTKAGALSVIIVDRLLGLMALVLFALVALAVSNTLRVPFVYLWVLAGAVGILLTVWFIYNPPLRISDLFKSMPIPFSAKLLGISNKFEDAFLAFHGRRDVLLKALGLSIILQTHVVIHYFLIGMALDFQVPLNVYFLIIPLAIFVMMLPFSINAIGIRENIFVFLLATSAIPKTEAIAFAWLAYGMLIINALLGGLVYALRK